MSADTIARLKITLDDVKPAVLRRVEVPFDIRLDRLHLTIQAAMGWTNSHLYEIRAGDVGWSTPDPDADWAGDFLDARKARLGDVLEDIGTKTLRYLYDFGDGWEHTIKVERLIDPEPGALYPRLIEVSGRCPPEDCGGPWGYAELLEAIGSKARTPRRIHRVDRRRLRSRRRRGRVAHRRSRRPRQKMVAQARCKRAKPADPRPSPDKWVADFTYIWTGGRAGCMWRPYIDLFSRQRGRLVDERSDDGTSS